MQDTPQPSRTQAERIAQSQGLDPDAHLTRRELRAKRRARRNRRGSRTQRQATPIGQNDGRIIKVEIIRRAGE